MRFILKSVRHCIHTELNPLSGCETKLETKTNAGSADRMNCRGSQLGTYWWMVAWLSYFVFAGRDLRSDWHEVGQGDDELAAPASALRGAGGFAVAAQHDRADVWAETPCSCPQQGPALRLPAERFARSCEPIPTSLVKGLTESRHPPLESPVPGAPAAKIEATVNFLERNFTPRSKTNAKEWAFLECAWFFALSL